MDTLELRRPHGFLMWRGKKRAVLRPVGSELPVGERLEVTTAGESFGWVTLDKPAKMLASEADRKEYADLHRVYRREREAWWPGEKQFLVYPVVSFEPRTEIKVSVEDWRADTEFKGDAPKFQAAEREDEVGEAEPGAQKETYGYAPTGDDVLVEEFVQVVGSAAEGDEAAADVDVLVRADREEGAYRLQAEGVDLAIRKAVDPGKDRNLHYLAHPSGPHQGTAIALADLVLRWHEAQAHEVKAGDEPLRVNLGCGDKLLDGYVNVDVRGEPDLLRDVREGLPFPDDSVDELRAEHFLEDLTPAEAVPLFVEVWRVLRPEGLFRFVVPHRDSAGASMPFHKSYWTEETFRAFASPELVDAYDLPPFEVVELDTEAGDGGVMNVAGAMRPVKGEKAFPKPQMSFFTDFFSPKELWDEWAKERAPVYAEEKLNGFRANVKKVGGKVQVRFEDSQKLRKLPGVDEQLSKVPDGSELDANVGVTEKGEPWARIKLMTLTSDKPELNGGKVVVTAFDVMKWAGEDVRKLPFSDRRKLLKGDVKKAGVAISDGREVKTLAELESAHKKLGKKPGSEGLVVKTMDAPYPTGAGTNEWAKIKNVLEIKAIVLESKTTKNGQHNFRGGLLPGDTDYPNRRELDGKEYIDLGFSFNAPFTAKSGSVVTFEVEEIILQENGHLGWLGAKPVDVDKARSRPYTASQAVGMAKRARILQDATKALVERGEAAAAWWKDNWHKQPPKSGKGDFTWQHHWRGLSEDETKLSEDKLLETDHSIHGDLRATNQDGELWGFSVFLGTTADNRAGDRLAELPEGDNLQGSWKMAEPKDWLTVARRSPYIGEPGEVGSTSKKWSKFFEEDHGTYEVGVWREHMMEVFLHGGKLKGRYLFEFAPVGGKRIWLIDRPKDQTPYAESHDKDETIAELKKKRQGWLVWAKPGEKPEFIEVGKKEAELMPYEKYKDGDRWCVREVDGETKHCYEGRGAEAKADRYLTALRMHAEAGEKEPDPADFDEKAGRRIKKTMRDRIAEAIDALKDLLTWADYEDDQPLTWADLFKESSMSLALKAADGEPWLFTWSSNAFIDRDGEIFSTDGLERYVAENEEKDDKGFFNFWHVPRTDFARKEWQGVIGRFLLETGPFTDDAKGHAARKFFTAYPNSHPEVAPEGWGGSIEYRYLPEERKAGTYENTWITRTSVLPRMNAANIRTRGGVRMALTKKQKEALNAIFPEDAESIIDEAEAETKRLEEAGVEFKDSEEAKAGAGLSKIAKKLMSLAKGAEGKLKDELEALAQELEGYGYPEPKAMEEDEEKYPPPKKKEAEPDAEPAPEPEQEEEKQQEELVLDMGDLAAKLVEQMQPQFDALSELAANFGELAQRVTDLEGAKKVREDVEVPRMRVVWEKRAIESQETKVEDDDELLTKGPRTTDNLPAGERFMRSLNKEQ